MADGVASCEVDRAHDHVRGGVDTELTLIMYGDYECPYSRQAYRGAQRAERALGSSLLLAFRHFPLTGIHPHAEAAALAAEAADHQGAFWAMHDALFHGQQALDDDHLRGYAMHLGLDVTKFEADRRASTARDRVVRDVTSGEASGVSGTPALFLNGRRYTGSYARRALLDTLRQIMSSAGDAT